MPDPLVMDSKLAASFGNRSLSEAYATLPLFKSGPGAGLGAGLSDGACAARFELDDDLSPLFPICGYATCMAFAAALSRQYTSMVKCPTWPAPWKRKPPSQCTTIREIFLERYRWLSILSF